MQMENTGLLFRMKNFRPVIADLEFKHGPSKQGAMGSDANCMLLKPALIRRIKSCAFLFLKVSFHSIFRNVPTRLEAKHFICSLKRQSCITVPIWSALNARPLGYQKSCLRAVLLAKSGAHQSGAWAW